MQHYKIVDDSLEKELLATFQDIDKILDMEETKTYTQVSISIFDHWLSKEEAYEKLNKVPSKEQQQRDAKHFTFSKLLIGKMKVFGYIYFKKTEEQKFVEFTSEKQLLKYMKRLSHFYVVIPEIESIYIHGFDDTNHLYYKNKNILEQIEPLVKQANLYLI